MAIHFAFMLGALLAGTVCGGLENHANGLRRRNCWLTLGVAALLLATFRLQTALPQILPLMQRDPALVTRGELWRAVSALFVQDGGTAGLVFNLVWLLLLGATAELAWDRRRWIAVYVGCGIATEFLALAWQPYGAGNSIAYFALAGALVTRVLRRRTLLRIGMGVAGMAAGAALLIGRDIHGIGFTLGALLGAVLLLGDRGAAVSAPQRAAVPGRSATGG